MSLWRKNASLPCNRTENEPSTSAPESQQAASTSDTPVDSCICFVCSVAIREATSETDGEPALWCEGRHKQWAHASCVNVSEDLYQALQDSSMPWACATCMKEALKAYHSLPDLQRAVDTLKSSVAALTLKVAQLKDTTQEPTHTSAPSVSAQTKTWSNVVRGKGGRKGKAKLGSGAAGKGRSMKGATTGSSPRPGGQSPGPSKRPPGESSGMNGNSLPPSSNGTTDGDHVHKHRVPVKGARKVWGTLRSTTKVAVENAIKNLTNTSTKGLVVKRKFKTACNDASRVTKWWFVIRGEESVLEELQKEWPTIALQTSWKLEPVLSYADDPVCLDGEQSSMLGNQSVRTIPNMNHQHQHDQCPVKNNQILLNNPISMLRNLQLLHLCLNNPTIF